MVFEPCDPNVEYGLGALRFHVQKHFELFKHVIFLRVRTAHVMMACYRFNFISAQRKVTNSFPYHFGTSAT